jgi:hypothetical protein
MSIADELWHDYCEKWGEYFVILPKGFDAAITEAMRRQREMCAEALYSSNVELLEEEYTYLEAVILNAKEES